MVSKKIINFFDNNKIVSKKIINFFDNNKIVSKKIIIINCFQKNNKYNIFKPLLLLLINEINYNYN